MRLKLPYLLVSGEQAQALIETAVSLPLLMLVLLGAAEFGQAAYVAIEVSNAAKAAAAYGAQNAVTAADITGMQLAASRDAANLPGSSGFAAAVDNTKCSCVTSGTPATASVAACTSACAGYIAQVITVDTSASYAPITQAMGLNTSFTLRGHAVQEVLR